MVTNNVRTFSRVPGVVEFQCDLTADTGGGAGDDDVFGVLMGARMGSTSTEQPTAGCSAPTSPGPGSTPQPREPQIQPP